MSPKKKRRSSDDSDSDSRRKFTDEERRDAERKHAPAPVERGHFEEVIRRLVSTPAPKKR